MDIHIYISVIENFMDIYDSLKNCEYQITDLHNCLVDTYNWIMDVHN